nr:chorion class high-cysteine HCB protein 13 [uncultured Clostridium sp.]
MPYNGYGNGCGNGENGMLWIIILLAFCGGGNGFGNCGNGCDDGCGDNNGMWLILILLLACGGCGNGFGGNGFMI